MCLRGHRSGQKKLMSNANVVFFGGALTHPGSEIPEPSRARTNVGSAPAYTRIAKQDYSAPSN